MATASSKPSKLEKKLLEQLDCPICLEVYTTPRSLTCLHTFCEGCIQSHILQEADKGTLKSTIQCPICRTDTASPCPTKPRREWARELPVNSALVPLLETIGRDSHIDCDNCKESDKRSAAKSFCKDCKQYQCVECSAVHTKAKLLKGHAIVKLAEMTAGTCVDRTGIINLGKLEFCQKHEDKEVKFYCEDDKVLCCTHCAIVHHRACKTMTDVTQLGNTLKEGHTPQKLQSQMRDLETRLSDIKAELDSNISDIEKQAENIPKQMMETQYRIMKVLDQLVAKVTADCGQLKKLHKTEQEDKITSIKSLEAAIITSRSLLDTLIKHGTETQMFIVIHKLEEQVSQYQTQVKDVGKNTKTVALSLTFNDCLNNIIQSPGSLTATVTEKMTRLKSGKVPIAECVIQNQPVIDIKQRGQQQQPRYRESDQLPGGLFGGYNQHWIDINKGGQQQQPEYRGLHWAGSLQQQQPRYYGSDRLPDGRLVAADYEHSLICLMDDTFNVTADIKLPSQPSDLTVMGPTEVVVTLPKTKQLQCIRVKGTTLKLTRVIPCSRKPYSVCRFSDTELAVGYDTGMGILTLDGTERSYIDKDKSGRQIQFSGNDRILSDVVKPRVYRSRYDDSTVYCLDFTGHVHFSYSNNLQGPCGLALDRDHNLYICSMYSGRVHQVSPDGQKIREIYPGLNYPFTVCFNPAGDTMTVMNGIGPTKQGTKIEFRQ